MTKILQATVRGQVTLPKAWREKFNTKYYIVEVKDDQLVLKPLPKQKSLADEVQESWNQYKQGDFTDGEDLMKKYGL